METSLEEDSRTKEFDGVIFGASDQVFSRYEDSSTEVTYTYILQTAGEFGCFQRILVALTFIPNILSAFFMLGGTFMLKMQPHHCNTDWLLAIQPNLTMSQLFNLTLPRKKDGSFEECRMYTPVQWDFDSIVKYGLNDTQDCQNGWFYLSHEWSLITEFDLVCNKASERLRAYCIFVAGLFCGSLLVGTLCDRIGRYKSILLMLMFYAVFGLGAAFVPTFSIYQMFQFGIGIAIMGYTISSISLVIEWLVSSRRVHAIVLAQCFLVLGHLVLSVLSASIPHWRLLHLVGSIPVIFLVSYIWLLPESPLWLMMRGNVEKAKFLLCRAASINKRIIPPELLQKLTNEKIHQGTIMDILKSPNLRRRTLILSYVWLCIGLGYVGLSSQLHKFPINMNGSHLAFRLVEVPARLCSIISMEKLGRRKSQVLALLLGGLTCLYSAFIPEGTTFILPQPPSCLSTPSSAHSPDSSFYR
ncbi:solute carrier family 22 member 14-like isoform X2 [Notamacropus eugenii]|uniref:solute carrier family 22 member 14-like isoform X2 n=1 Tax=Notamacropus eugenii TaxID=9315 RepID=UPI003B6736FA